MSGNFWVWAGWIVTNLIVFILATNIGDDILGHDDKLIARYMFGMIVVIFIWYVVHINVTCFNILIGGLK
jgi:hypothetical protein